MDITNEVKKELKKGENWAEQVINIIRSFAWAFGSIMISTSVLVTFILLIALTVETGESWSFSGFKNGVEVLFISCLVVNIFTVTIFGLPNRLRNIFKENAESSIRRKEEIQREIEVEIDITETLLTQYGLITEQDKEDRRAKLKSGCLL